MSVKHKRRRRLWLRDGGEALAHKDIDVSLDEDDDIGDGANRTTGMNSLPQGHKLCCSGEGLSLAEIRGRPVSVGHPDVARRQSPRRR